MKKNTIDKGLLIQKYSLKIHKMEMGFSNLRNELKKLDFDSEDIDLLVKQIDRNVTKIALTESEVAKGKNELFMGIILTSLGLIVTIGTYIGFINLGRNFLILYGPVATGIALIVHGKKKVNMKKSLNVKI